MQIPPLPETDRMLPSSRKAAALVWGFAAPLAAAGRCQGTSPSSHLAGGASSQRSFKTSLPVSRRRHGQGRDLLCARVRERRHPILQKKLLAWISRGGFDSSAAAARRDTTRFTLVTMNCHSLADRDCLADSQGWLSTRMNTFLLSGAK